MMKQTFPHSSTGSIEVLESRIAPASLVTFNYTDVDGNAVSISSSKGTLAQLTAAIETMPGAGDTLQVLAIHLGSDFQGANISIVAGASATDLITTKIGYLDATGIDLGNVSIDGDIGQIDAGDSNSKSAAFKSLEVGSWGVAGVSTQAVADAPVDPSVLDARLDSLIIGGIKSLTVHGDFTGVKLSVQGDNSGTVSNANGKIKSLTIDGSIIGDVANFSGSISTTGATGGVTIGGDVLGGDGNNTGTVVSGGSMGKLSVTGAIKGGNSTDNSFQSGRIFSGGKLGAVTVGGGIFGGNSDVSDVNIFGGASSGQVSSTDSMGRVEITGGLHGGTGFESGAVGSGGRLNFISVDGGITGGSGGKSGALLATASLGTVVVNGDLTGGAGQNSGNVAASVGVNKVTINGDIVGGDGFQSGDVGSFDDVGSVLVTGSITGGGGDFSGGVLSTLKIKSVTVNGSVVGGGGRVSGGIGSLKGLGIVTIGEDLVAGVGDQSGSISAQDFDYTDESPIPLPIKIGKVVIGGSIFGDPQAATGGQSAGSIAASGDIGSISVGGGIFGGTQFYSGSILSNGAIKTVDITGGVSGGGNYGAGIIQGYDGIRSVSIGGSLTGGAGQFSGVVASFGSLGKVSVNGDVTGGDGAYSGLIQVSSSDHRAGIKSIFIGGNLVGSQTSSGANDSGEIYSSGFIKTILIGSNAAPGLDQAPSGSIIGGTAAGSGRVNGYGGIGSIKLLGNLQGSDSDQSGKIFSSDGIDRLEITGSIIGGLGNFDTTVVDDQSIGQVYAAGHIGSVVVGHDIVGGQGNASGQIRGHDIKSVFVGAIGERNGGDIIGGPGAGSGALIAFAGDIDSAKINGSLYAAPGSGPGAAAISAHGSIGNVSVLYLSGQDVFRPVVSAVDKIGTVSVGEASFYADILAGYDIDGNLANGSAEIGKVIVGTGSGPGQFQASNIVAGIHAGGDGYFGSFDDQSASNIDGASGKPSKIGSVVIGNVIEPQPGSNGSPTFGIVADQVVSVKVAGSPRPLTGGAFTDTYASVVGESSTYYGELPFNFNP